VTVVADIVVRLRLVIVLAWIGGAAAATAFLPTLGSAQGGALGNLVPVDAPAAETQLRSAQLFRLPVLANTAVVQRDPEGLSSEAQLRVVERARAVTEGRYGDLLSLELALPVLNTGAVLPGSRESSTTAITFLYPEPQVSLTARDRLARWFVDGGGRFTDADAVVGVTGAVPARVEQGRLIEDALPLIELATIGVIAIVVGVTFRSVVAPFVVLAAVAVSFLAALRFLGAAGAALGISVPRELEPIMLVILLGIVTDYSIFYLSGTRNRMQDGASPRAAAHSAIAQVSPIVVVAGLIVASSCLSLLVARLEFFRVLGPGIALTVLVGLAVAVTFVPALLALLGPAVFWPSTPRAPQTATRSPLSARLMATRRRAGLVAAASALVLGAGAVGVIGVRLAPTPITSLPESSGPASAAASAASGFAPGMLAPTLLLLEGPDIGERQEALARFQRLVAARPGVAGTLGPANVPDIPRGLVVSPDGDAARVVVILDEHPFGSRAIDVLEDLRGDMTELTRKAGVGGTIVGVGGNTALAAETVDTVLSDLVRIGLTVLGINLVFLVLFLRALVAPLYLLAASVLALATSIGLTTAVFQRLLGEEQLTYYVPFVAAVLLVALGSDYNVFLVGRIWQEARRRPLPEAIAHAVPRASHAITAAGVALAASFALLALVPVTPFRELALAMVVGVVLDAFVVRSLLVPALVRLVGTASGWPGRLEPRPAVREPLD
jgi:RND superfamily putative drug exporter